MMEGWVSWFFCDAEKLAEENIVTFINLALFWHSSGKWKVAYLHKGIVLLLWCL
ncbi:hypothetical protein F5Y16DRAFT_271266 [Xylariaceae sp. FL0255]|nr:hypothetical protein F5Y16DRAFT_271266 [Xylariaceae sp. FL0255]